MQDRTGRATLDRVSVKPPSDLDWHSRLRHHHLGNASSNFRPNNVQTDIGFRRLFGNPSRFGTSSG